MEPATSHAMCSTTFSDDNTSTCPFLKGAAQASHRGRYSEPIDRLKRRDQLHKKPRYAQSGTKCTQVARVSVWQRVVEQPSPAPTSLHHDVNVADLAARRTTCSGAPPMCTKQQRNMFCFCGSASRFCRAFQCGRVACLTRVSHNRVIA